MTDDVSAAPSSLEGAWTFVEGYGPDGVVVAIPGHPITLEIEGDRWAGSAGCNRYTTMVSWDGEHLVLPRGIATTLMACADDVVAAERAYLDVLPLVETIDRSEDRVTLRGPDVELVFRPTTAAPADVGATTDHVADTSEPPLIGRDWSIVALVGRSPDAPTTPVVGEPSLHLAEGGALAGTTGCNRFMGRYELTGTTLTIGPLATTRMACDEAATGQEAHVLQVLSDATLVATFADDTLRLLDPSGSGLHLRAVAAD